MNKLGLIVILNVWKRQAEGRYLQKLLQTCANEYGIEVLISYDDGTLGIWKNYKNALVMGKNPGSHRIIIHDDVTFDRMVLEKTIHVLNHLPEDSYLSLFNPDNNDYKMAVASGNRILKTTTNFWLPGVVYEDAETLKFIEWQDKYVRDEFPDNDDGRLHFYMQENNRFMYSIVPGLIQHIGAYRSNFKTGGKVGKNARWSATVNSSQNVYTVDWSYEFKNPYVCKVRRDYDKIATESYFKDHVGR